jgi:hypothetical protein
MTGVQARLAERPVLREEVLAWEDKRIVAAAKKLAVRPPTGGDVAARREAFLATKLALGPDAMLRRLRRDLAWADRVARMQARLSGRRRICSIAIDAPGTAAEFTEFFEAATARSDEATMMRACPDHFVIRTGPSGQEVVETNGGSPLAARFTIDYDDVSSLTTPADPEFPFQVAGVARASDGTAIGGVRQQFRDTAAGFEARLTVEFPLPTLPSMISGHRWHLACEFSNWIEAALDR